MTGDLALTRSATPAVETFDYAVLSPDVAKHAQAAAHRIKRQEQKATDAMFEIGRDLIAVKAMLDHGQFVRWVEAECSSAVRTVQNYMKAAQAFEGKYATVAHLPPSTVYALAAAPADTRAAVIGRLERGERLSERSVQDALWEERQARKMAKADAKLTPAQRKAKTKRKEADDREREKHKREWEERLAARRLALERAASLIVSAMPADAWTLSDVLEAAGQYQELVDAIRDATPPEWR